MEANGIEHTVTDQGEPVFRHQDWLGWASEHFAYLDPKVVNGHALVHATGSLIVFSEELVRRLGTSCRKTRPSCRWGSPSAEIAFRR
jgi:hypothetical protein